MQEWEVEDIPAPKKVQKLPVILSRQEVVRFLESIDNLKHRTLLNCLLCGRPAPV